MKHKDFEKILHVVVRKVYNTYPSVEYEDLIAQGWLIVCECLPDYDGSKGASLSTFVHNQLNFKLQDYVRRDILKELNMGGHRDHSGYLEAETGSIEDQVCAKVDMDLMIEKTDGVSRDILSLMSDGYTQTEVSEALGISRQAVSKRLTKIREDFE